MKRNLIALFSLLIWSFIFPVNAYAAETYGDFEYVVVDGDVRITSYEGYDLEVVVPSLINGKKVTSIGSHAFSNKNMVSITLPETLMTIGDYAFYECSNLSGISFPETLTYIGTYAFDRCTSLTRITIPKNVKTVGTSAFDSCSNLVTVKFSEGIVNLWEYSFVDCIGLETIAFPSTLKGLGNSMFSGCTSLKNVTLPKGVQDLGKYTFSGCTLLETVSIQEGLQSLGEGTFYGCSTLKTIKIPSTVKSIGASVFSGCSGFTEFDIPNTINTIGWRGFGDCYNLKTVSVPESVNKIDQDAFKGISGNAIINYAGNYVQWNSIIYDSSNYDNISVVFGKLTPQTIKGESEYSAEYRDSSFNLYQECDGEGELVYTSNDSTVASVSSEGMVTVGNAGTAVISVYAKQTKYYAQSPTKNITVTVSPMPLQDYYSVASISDKAYTGQPIKPIVTVEDYYENALIEGKDFDVRYENNINVGYAKVIVTGKGNYTGKKGTEFEIIPKEITPEIVLSESEYVYDGTSKKPGVTVKDGSTILDATCYTVSYASGRKNAGKYKVSVELKGNYKGSGALSFVIKPKEVVPTVTLSKTSYVYDGSLRKPAVTVKDGDTKITSSNYKVSYGSDRRNAGTYKVTVTLKKNYSGTKAVAFKITKAQQPMTAKGKTVYVGEAFLKKKDKVLKAYDAVSVNRAKGTKTYSIISKGKLKNVKIDKKSGKIIVPKKTKKGTYTIKVKVTAAGTKNYKKGSKTVSVKIRVE